VDERFVFSFFPGRACVRMDAGHVILPRGRSALMNYDARRNAVNGTRRIYRYGFHAAVPVGKSTAAEKYRVHFVFIRAETPFSRQRSGCSDIPFRIVKRTGLKVSVRGALYLYIYIYKTYSE